MWLRTVTSPGPNNRLRKKTFWSFITWVNEALSCKLRSRIVEQWHRIEGLLRTPRIVVKTNPRNIEILGAINDQSINSHLRRCCAYQRNFCRWRGICKYFRRMWKRSVDLCLTAVLFTHLEFREEISYSYWWNPQQAIWKEKQRLEWEGP